MTRGVGGAFRVTHIFFGLDPPFIKALIDDNTSDRTASVTHCCHGIRDNTNLIKSEKDAGSLDL